MLVFNVAFCNNLKVFIVILATFSRLQSSISRNFIIFAPNFNFIEHYGKVKSYKSSSCRTR